MHNSTKNAQKKESIGDMEPKWFTGILVARVSNLRVSGTDYELLEVARELERAITMLRDELELRRENREARK